MLLTKLLGDGEHFGEAAQAAGGGHEVMQAFCIDGGFSRFGRLEAVIGGGVGAGLDFGEAEADAGVIAVARGKVRQEGSELFDGAGVVIALDEGESAFEAILRGGAGSVEAGECFLRIQGFGGAGEVRPDAPVAFDGCARVAGLVVDLGLEEIGGGLGQAGAMGFQEAPGGGKVSGFPGGAGGDEKNAREDGGFGGHAQGLGGGAGGGGVGFGFELFASGEVEDVVPDAGQAGESELEMGDGFFATGVAAEGEQGEGAGLIVAMLGRVGGEGGAGFGRVLVAQGAGHEFHL